MFIFGVASIFTSMKNDRDCFRIYVHLLRWGQTYQLNSVVVDIPEDHSTRNTPCLFFSCPTMNEPVQLRTNYPEILSVRTRRRKMRAVPRYKDRSPAAKVCSLLGSATSYSSTECNFLNSLKL
jgi:hypothetical protein